VRIGIGLETGGTIDEVTARARAVAETGVECLWTSQIFGWDSLTLLALLGREVPGVGLGTAVVPVHPRHPTMLAAQALTVQAATGGRLQLGIGLSHKMVVEGVWGLSFDRPARYMDEYLSILMPLLEGESVSFNGELLRTNTLGPLATPAAKAPPVLVAALAPAMLGIAGRKASGTVTWMVGLKTLSEHIVPTISSAASTSGRPAPRVAVNLPVSVTADREDALQRAGRIFSMYGQLPSYRAMLDREGVEGPSDVAIVGDEEHVARSIERFSDVGATEFSAAAFGTPDDVARTYALLGEMAKR
jgi:F420-dependent oxidoreductase-like protein